MYIIETSKVEEHMRDSVNGDDIALTNMGKEGEDWRGGRWNVLYQLNPCNYLPFTYIRPVDIVRVVLGI